MDPLTLLAQAKDKALAGDIEGSRLLRAQAEEIKAISDAEQSTKSVKSEPAARLPFDTSATVTPPSDVATKSWYVSRFGEPEVGFEQIVKELYGAYGVKSTDDYMKFTAAKYRDMERYLRTGQIGDYKMSRALLLTPEQMVGALAAGVPLEDGQTSIKATMVEAQGELGGYVAPEAVASEMLTRLPGLTVVRSLARTTQIGARSLPLMVRRGGNRRYIGNIRSVMTDESPSSATISETNMLFGRVEIPVHVNLANVPVSKTLFEDSVVNLTAEITQEFTTQAAILEDEQFLVGDGVGKPQGILNGIAAGNTPLNTDTYRQASLGATSLAFDSITGVPWLVPAQYRNRNAASVAFAFSSMTGSVLATLKDGKGQYLWSEMYGNNAVSNPDTLRGFKYRESEALPNPSGYGVNTFTANLVPILFGDFSGYRIVDRIGMSIERYSDALTASTDTVIFYCRRRYGGQLVEGWKMAYVQIAAS